MKKFTKIPVFMFAIAIFFASCNKNETAPEVVTEADFSDKVYVLDELSVFELPELLEPTEDVEFGIRDSVRMRVRENCTGKLENRRSDQNLKGNLPFIFRQLDLSTEQINKIKRSLLQHCECQTSFQKRLLSIHRETLARANAKRSELLEAYRNGRITRAELGRKLSELRNTYQKQLRENNLRVSHYRAMQQCREELMKNITSTLNREQLAKWNRWLESHK